MNNQELRDEILNNIPFIPELFWSYNESSEQEMENITSVNISPNIDTASPLAFAARSNGYEGVYEIYVNPNVPNACRVPLRMHERGHIIFTHMSLAKNQRDIIIQKILTHWDKIKSRLSDDVLKGEESSVAKTICNMILNIAMDYEVNSKLFTDDEWEKMVEYTQWAYISALANAPKSTTQELKAALKFVNGETTENLFKPCHPKNVGYPSELDYRQYIDLMLMKPEKFMDDLIANLKANSSSDSDGKLSKEEIDKLKASIDTDVEKNEELKEPDNENTHGWSVSKSVKSNKKLYITQSAELARRIEKSIYNRNIYINYNDPLHYTNRGKYNSEMIVNYERREDLYVPGDIYLLVDCSGSIGRKTIGTLIGTVKNIAKRCGPKSRIIWWSDELNSDTPLREVVENPGYGGTNIGEGIKYVKDNYLKNKNDKLVIISDYEDALVYWYEELKDIKNDCVGICWRVENGYNGDLSDKDFIMRMGWCDTDESESFKSKFLKKLPTNFVWIPSSFEEPC